MKIPDFFFMRAFMKVTEPMIRAMSFLTPSFLVDRLKTALCGLVLVYDPVLFNAIISWL
jgi:hypothetical protein